MIERLKAIAAHYHRNNMTELARTIGVRQSTISSALGRGSCSFDMIVKLLSTYSEINPEWLVMGKGSMLKEKTLSALEIEQLRNKIADLERRNIELENDKKMLQLLVNTLSTKVGVTLNNAQIGNANTQHITDTRQ